MTPLSIIAICTFIIMILLNLVKRNDMVVTLFQIMSALVAAALMTLGYTESAYGLLVAGVLSLLVKAIIAPVFLNKRIKEFGSVFSPASYLRLPMTLVVLTLLTGFSYSIVQAITPNATDPSTATILLASIFGMCFFMVNRTGTLSQIVGILGIENSIVLFTVFLGVAHSIALEIAVAFDILVWVAIATTFLTLIYRQFGLLEHVQMTHLKEE